MEVLRGQTSHEDISVSEILTKPTAERILETSGGISSKDYSSTKALLQDGSYFSPTHLSSFESTGGEKTSTGTFMPLL